MNDEKIERYSDSVPTQWRLGLSTGFFVCIYAARASLFPFLPLYFLDVGFSAAETGFICGIKALIHVASAPLWVIFARQVGSPRLLKAIVIVSLLIILALNFTISILPKTLGFPDDGHCSANGSKAKNGSAAKRDAEMADLASALSAPRISNETIQDVQLVVLGTVKRQVPRGGRQSNLADLEEIVIMRPPSESSAPAAKHDDYAGQLLPDIDEITHRGYARDLWLDVTGIDAQPLFTGVLCIVVAESLFTAPVEKMADDMLYNYLDRNDNLEKQGFYQLFCSVATALAGLVSATVANYVDCGFFTGLPFMYLSHYNYLFLQFAMMMIGAICLAPLLPYEDGIGDVFLFKCFKVLTQDPSSRIIYYCLTVLFMGMGHAIIYIFLLAKIFDLSKGDRQDGVIGGMIVVGAVAEMFMLLFGKDMIRRFSLSKVMSLSLLAQGLRLAYYGLMEIPWTVIPFELLYMFSNTLLWICLYNYVEFVCVPFMEREVYFVVQTTFWGTGYALGAILGGRLYDIIDPTMILFFIFSGLMFLWFVLYLLLNRFCRTNKQTAKKVRPTIHGWMVEPKVTTTNQRISLEFDELDLPYEQDSDPTLETVASRRQSMDCARRSIMMGDDQRRLLSAQFTSSLHAHPEDKLEKSDSKTGRFKNLIKKHSKDKFHKSSKEDLAQPAESASQGAGDDDTGPGSAAESRPTMHQAAPAGPTDQSSESVQQATNDQA